MKKSNKCDFKKLALLGIAGGTALAGQAVADLNNYSQLLAFNGCGGEHGCNHGGPKKGTGANSNGNYYQAYRNVSSQGCNASSQTQYYQPSQPSQSCSAQAQQTQYYQPSQPSQSCSAQAPQTQYYQPSQPSQSCSAQAPQTQYYQSQPTQVSQGCGATKAQYYQSQPTQISQGCGASKGQSYQPTQISSGCAAHAPQGQPQTPAAPNQSGAYSKWETSYTADASKPATFHRSITEGELLPQLNEQGKAAYQGLDSAGKALALKLANQDCKGHNECKGLNSCKTEDHSCAGKGSCSGTAKSNFKDKNLAVKVAALKMAEKRANASSSK